MPSADTVIVAAPMPTPFTIPSETDEPLSPLAAVILIPAATADANNVLTLVRIKFEKYTSGAPHDIEITFGICSIPSTTTGTVVAYLNTFINSAREFGAIYKIIVKFDVGQHAPIIFNIYISTSIVFSIVAPSDAFGEFVAPSTSTTTFGIL